MVDAETAKLVQNLKDRLKTFDEDLDRVKKAAQKIHHDLNYVKADEHEEEPIYENSNISHISQRPNPVSNSFVHGRHEVVHGHDSGDGGPGGTQRFQMTKNPPKIGSNVISRIFPNRFQLICIISVSGDCMHSIYRYLKFVKLL